MSKKLMSAVVLISASLFSLCATAEVARNYSCVNEAHSKLKYTATISDTEIKIRFGTAGEGEMETDVKNKKANLVFDHNSDGWSSYKGEILVEPKSKSYRTLEASLEPKNLDHSAAFKMNLFIGNEHGEGDDSYTSSVYGMTCTLK